MVSNVETLAAVLPVIAAGCGGHARERQSATRLFGVSGPVNCPGIVEVPSGVTLRELVFDVAAGLRDRRSLKGVRVAGSSGVVLGPDSLDVSLGSLDAFSAGVGGVIPIPEGDSAVEIEGALRATV